MINRMTAEFVGTLVLVFFGCGAAVLGPAPFDQLAVSLAFGFAIVAMAYGIGPISGCHVNPAVSLAAFIARRMSAKDMAYYWVAQFAGAIAGAGLLAIIAKTGTQNLGQNGWGAGYLGEYPMMVAGLFEVLMTAIFVTVILGVSGDKGHGPFAGVAIGITLAAIHIVGIQVTGVSVNPARSLGPALLVGGQALSQVWLFIIAPAVGAVIGACLFRFGLLETRRMTDAAA